MNTMTMMTTTADRGRRTTPASANAGTDPSCNTPRNAALILGLGGSPMTARILDGKLLAQTMQAEIAARVADFTHKHGVRPGLAAVLVGDNPASQVYVRNKRKACEQLGIQSWLYQLPAETLPADLLLLISQLNDNPQVHGILVQLPLPKQIDENTIIQAV